MKTRLIWGLLLIALPAAAMAQPYTLMSSGETIAPLANRTLSFPAVSKDNVTVLLTVRSRMNYPSWAGGSNAVLHLVLNGTDIQATVDSRTCRLLNKPVISPIGPGTPGDWFYAGSNVWRVVYGPDFTASYPSYYTWDPLTLTLDVTDLVRSSSGNSLQVFNYTDTYTLVFDTVQISTRAGASPLTQPATAAPVINRGQSQALPAAYTYTVHPGGGFSITVSGREWKFASAFSYPGSSAQRNRLVPLAAPDNTSGQTGWTVSVNGNTVTAAGPTYRVNRTLQVTSRKITVYDNITNLTAAALGLVVRHETALDNSVRMPVRLAGNPDPTLASYFSPGNPSVYIAAPDHGLGIVCEDDVLRNQASLVCGLDLSQLPPEVAGLEDRMLRLGPSAGCTVSWSVYPVASLDYYDFVNLVREDWGANFTLDGGWAFFNVNSMYFSDASQLGQQYGSRGIKYALSSGWIYYYNLTRLGMGKTVMSDSFWSDFRTKTASAKSTLATNAPATRMLVYYDNQRDTSSPALSGSNYATSWLTDAGGNWVYYANVGGVTYSPPWYSMVPTRTNQFGADMVSVANWYMTGPMGANGLFCDEMENVAYGQPYYTYNVPDNRTCLLTDSCTIDREVGLIPLLGETHRLDVIDNITSRGGSVIGNGPAHTRAMLGRHVPRFIEINHNDYWHYEGDLNSPLGLVDNMSDFSRTLRTFQFAELPVWPGDTASGSTIPQISAYLFPFTPVELHYGYLLGQERIIATHQGNFGWSNDCSLVQVRHFNSGGSLDNATDNFTTTIASGAARTSVPIPDSNTEAVVLERLPVTLEPQP